MLSPLREPVYAASARTLSGSLAEMERIIGETLFSGYVGYNGRAPGCTTKKEELQESAERNRTGGDARHTLVAYFEIVELASILCVDRETTNLAIRTFRHTANNTSLRNRNVESLATAAFVSAAERRWNEYQDWSKVEKGAVPSDKEPHLPARDEDAPAASSAEWPTVPRHLSVEEISTAANLDVAEVVRYLKVVNIALRKQRPENSSSIAAHMPTFCSRLDLPERTRRLAIGIAEKAMENNICSRRYPPSLSAAAIRLACQLDGVRKTQVEICRATPVTDVTLRKVHKELIRDESMVIPEWYKNDKRQQTEATFSETARPFARPAARRVTERASSSQEDREESPSDEKPGPAADSSDLGSQQEEPNVSLVPPPLPPGFGKGQGRPKAREEEKKAEPVVSQPQPPLPGSNSMLAMLNNPTMQAFANVFAMMPQLSPPPPPALPPLPSASDSKGSQVQARGPGDSSEKADAREVTPPPENDVGKKNEESRSLAATKPQQSQPVQSSQPLQANGNLMGGMQSMMKMVQAMQAIQAMQKQTVEQKGGEATEQLNPIAMMAMAMAQAQNAVAMASKSTVAQAQPNTPQDSSQAKPALDEPGPEAQGTKEQNQLEN